MASVIETKINRLASAKTAIKAAIEGKGVTVPDATLLDGMAALIESIEAGGGGGNLFGTACTYGTFTPSEKLTPASNAITIEHGLGQSLFGFLIFRTTAYPEDIWGEIGFIGLLASYRKPLRTAYGCYSSLSGNGYNNTCKMIEESADDEQITFKTDKYGYFNAGTTYIWFAFGQQK